MFAFVSTINVIASVSFIIAVFIIHGRFRGNPAYWAMVLWFGHAAVYWTTILALRVFTHYTGPSVWVSTWAAAVFLHASFAIIGDRIARKAA